MKACFFVDFSVGEASILWRYRRWYCTIKYLGTYGFVFYFCFIFEFYYAWVVHSFVRYRDFPRDLFHFINGIVLKRRGRTTASCTARY